MQRGHSEVANPARPPLLERDSGAAAGGKVAAEQNPRARHPDPGNTLAQRRSRSRSLGSRLGNNFLRSGGAANGLRTNLDAGNGGKYDAPTASARGATMTCARVHRRLAGYLDDASVSAARSAEGGAIRWHPENFASCRRERQRTRKPRGLI